MNVKNFIHALFPAAGRQPLLCSLPKYPPAYFSSKCASPDRALPSWHAGALPLNAPVAPS